MAHRRSKMQAAESMEGGSLVAPQMIAAEAGMMEALKQSHIKVDDRAFPIDPNLDFDSSVILCEDRAYNADSIADITQPITYTIQPQYNVFRSFSESRFVFRLQLAINTGVVGAYDTLSSSLKPYFSALFINDITININNVACNDQHSRTAQYAHFVKTVLLQANLKPVVSNVQTYSLGVGDFNYIFMGVLSVSSEDHRTHSEGIVNVDGNTGMDSCTASQNVSMFMQNGFLYQIGMSGPVTGATPPNAGFFVSAFGNDATYVAVQMVTKTAAFEITYIPKDGIWQQPKFLPPGVNLNFVMQIQPFTKWLNGWNGTIAEIAGNPASQAAVMANSPGLLNWISSATLLSAIYYERQYTLTQTALRAYQSLIMRQPLYFSCLTSNTLLFPVTSNSVQLTNLFAGRLPNIIVVGLLNQTPSNSSLNSQSLLCYSPLPGITENPAMAISTLDGRVVPTVACISSIVCTINGRRLPNLWQGAQTAGSSANVQQWYEQYKQCSLISRLAGRSDGATNTNYDTKYKFDTPLLSLSEFKSCFNLLCFNVRRNGTIVNSSGDKEVGGVEVLLTLSSVGGLVPPNAQLLLCGLNTDSICSITDGGSSTSFVY